MSEEWVIQSVRNQGKYSIDSEVSISFWLAASLKILSKFIFAKGKLISTVSQDRKL